MKNLAVITGTRAAYGLLRGVCKLLEEDNQINFILAVTGSHLSERHGNTFEEIKSDNFKNIYLVDLNIEGDSCSNINSYVARSIEKFDKFFLDRHFDIIIVLGDRYEILGASIAASFLNIPIAHIHGGELTEGAQDDFIRHTITKMSSLHFASTEAYRKRIIQLGEHPDTVFFTGGLGAENIVNMKGKLLSRMQIQEHLGIEFRKTNILFTYHPETLDPENCLSGLKEICLALSDLENTGIIITSPNADVGFESFFKTIKNFVNEAPKSRWFFASMGQLNYFSVLDNIDWVIGNSSSGLLEVPSFKVATIDVGNRQKGRVRADSVMNVRPLKSEILNAINKIQTRAFKDKLSKTINPYYKANTAKKIVECIKYKNIENRQKPFFDIVF